MKNPLPNIKNYIPDGTPVIKPGTNAHKGLSVPLIMFEHGHVRYMFKNMPRIINKMIPSVYNALKSYRSLKTNPSGKRTISADQLNELKTYIHELGCDKIGFTQVPKSYIFDDKVILFPTAIIITMEMKKDKIAQAPGIESGKEIWRTYYELGKIVNKIADWLRLRGFAASAGPAVGGETNYPLLAQKAGLGHIGRHGMLISSGTGPSQRIAAVYTNIENLPISDHKGHDWIAQFCDTCHRCVKACPAKAIYSDPIIFDDKGEQHIDYKKCAIPFSETMGCSVCIKECTFFRSDYEKIKQRFLS